VGVARGGRGRPAASIHSRGLLRYHDGPSEPTSLSYKAIPVFVGTILVDIPMNSESRALDSHLLALVDEEANAGP
jgi:hypothetical protein